MNQLLKLKWEQVPEFRKELETAKNKDFVHPVGDVFWGTGTKSEKGKNMFGVLLQNLLKSKLISPKRTTVPNSKTQTQTPTTRTVFQL